MTQTALTYRTNRDLFSNHYLTDHLRDTEPWNEVDDTEVREAYDEIRDLFEDKRDRVEDYNEAQLERNFIRPVFEILGVSYEIEETVERNARRPDYGFFKTDEAADAAFDRNDFYEEAIAVADAKRWGRKLDTRGEEKRDFENPSYQIHAYLQETPTTWAVLTNGQKWRLYYGPTSHRLDSYYEIDLPTLLQHVEEGGGLEDFKDFYLFFRKDAFVEDTTGSSFLDDVYEESSVFAEALGEDLQDNIYEAIRVLAEGFLDTNDELDEGDLELIHDSSLIYLYRLIFVLYAESEGRDLLPTENPIYRESYSLNNLKQTVAENRDETQQHYQSWQTHLWDRLEELFVLIDQGSHGMGVKRENLYIPAYNGGLFRTNPDTDDSEEAQFLANYEVGDAYLAEVIDLLTRREAEEGEGQVFVDYSSLDERHLGSIYEGLLEYQIDVADEPLTVEDGEYAVAEEDDEIEVKSGEVYLQTDAGERKATGSFYTPEYVVEHIVDDTLGPLVDDIRSDLLSESADTTHSREKGFAEEFAERVFDLRVLDPAMGSGHFLVNAVDYLAREIIDAQERQDQQAVKAGNEEAISEPWTEEGELRDINWARRKVAQRCIYGVDLNPLATELAKVSLWLRTLAAEQPLAFLDHHLKTGNSLVGSDIEEVLSNGESTADDGQLTLQQSFARMRQEALEHVMDRFQDLLSIDNETLEDVKEMEEVYEEVRDDPLYQHLLAMANVHTAEAFGHNVPTDAYERMAEALRDDSWDEIEGQGWFETAQSLAEEEGYFHWKLEFPVAFYGEDGELKDDAGFDAVIGNPPYVFITSIDQNYRDYYDRVSSTYDYRFDLYAIFIEKGLDLTVNGGGLSYIIPHNLLNNNSFELAREKLLSESRHLRVIDFTDDVFEDATNEPMIVYSSVDRKDSDMSTIEGAQIHPSDLDEVDRHFDKYPADVVDYLPGRPLLIRPAEWVADYVNLDNTLALEEFLDAQQGLRTGDNDRFLTENPDDDGTYRKIYRGSDIHRYGATWGGEYVLYDRDQLDAPRNEKYWEADEKLIAQAIRNSRYPRRIVATYDDEQYIGFNSTINFVRKDSADVSIFYLMAILSADLTNHYFWTCFIDNNLATQYFNSIPIPAVDFDSQDSQRLDHDRFNQMVEDYIDDENDQAAEFIRSKISPDTSDRVISHDILAYLAEWHTDVIDSRDQLNTDLLSYISPFEVNQKVSNIGVLQPAQDVQDTKLTAGSEEYDGLRIARVETEREGDVVTVWIAPKYKPENTDDVETTRHGYVEEDPIKAFEILEVDEETAVLLEEFIPVAVDEIGSEANFYKQATKTITLLDRVKDIQVPDISDIDSEFEDYVVLKNKERRYEKEASKLDTLTDLAVEELYGHPTEGVNDEYPFNE